MSKLGVLLSYWYRLAQRVLHTLVGIVFLIFAAAGGALAYSEWRRYRANPAVGPGEFGMFAGFTLLLVILALYSFLRARSVR